ncbi:DUF7144 family membrane protein [Planosporangium mesophilum]|uniref:DUF7144 domain-containing protein n=1 Tax=Planosporangium mesophilum TaxID=689768 RepID=A0A8J3T8G5_9ACTN|nr:hypothetical protein [Planosporangium mesophilum]NJC83044.1 hypothetical protein [Planosporangium mesophilum]GII22450.1 hypothetical protein Pme01_20470 [Planosporangium mesophilum]
MTQRTSVWSGWISFATVMLTMIGAFNIVEGLAALMTGTISFIDEGLLVVVNLTVWGVLTLVSGALLIAVGLGLISRSEVARVAAVVLIALHALVQLSALAAFPVWSLLMIALDVVVLFALTVHWPDRVAEAQPAGPAVAAAPSTPASAGTPRPAA